MVEISVKTAKEEVFVILVNDETTLLEFRTKVEQTLDIPVGDQRLISAGRIIVSEGDFRKVKHQEIPHIHACRKGTAVARGSILENSPALSKFESAWVLLSNSLACVCGYKNGTNPQNISRINTTNQMVLSHPPNPCAYDLAMLIVEMCSLYKNIANALEDCSKTITLPTSTHEEAIKNTNKAQLLLDSLRYLATLHELISGFIIPLRNPSPQFLSLVNRNRGL